MPTDITQVITASQDAIDAAVATIRATQKTQQTLQENIRTTDKKVGIHNTSGECHEDIRQQLGDMPSMITDPVISGPTAVETGEENSWLLSAAGIIPTTQVLSFDVVDQHGVVYNVPANESGHATFTHTFIGSRNQQIKFTVKAKGTYSFVSKEVSYDLLITQHLPPDMSKLTHTFPPIISYGKTYPWKVDGIFDLDNDLKEINILPGNNKVTLSQKDNIVQGLEYSLSVDPTYKGPDTFVAIIQAVDERGLINTHQIQMRVNSDPVVTGITHNIPTYLNKNSVSTVRVGNVIDPDDDVVTFSISSNNGNITFSKNENIALNEDFVITVGDIPLDTPYVLTLIFKDIYGGSTTKTISSKINTPPSIAGFVATQNSRHVVGKTTKMSFAGATDANGETVIYNINNTYPDLVFSKTVGIAENEQVDVTVLPSAAHGATYTLQIDAMDGSGGKTPVNVVIITNSLPVITNLSHNIPKYVAPGANYTWSVSGATDVDGQSLKYTITSSNPNVTLTNATSISAGQQFTCVTPTEAQLARGESFPLTISVTDGLEVVESTINVYQNKKPDISGLIGVTPTRVIPNSTQNISFYGAVDPDGQALTYSIVDFDTSALAFSKATGIVDNEQVVMTVKSAAVRGKTYEFTVRVIDPTGEYVDQKYSFKVNTLPDISSIAHNIASILKPATTYPNLQISGVTDADNDDLLFTITASNGVVINNGTAITSDELFTLVTPATGVLGRGNSFTVTVSVYDGYETVTKNFTFKINTLPDMSGVTTTLVTKLIPSTTYSGILVRGAVDSDGQPLKYTITASGGVTINDGASIDANSPIEVIIPNTTVLSRGSSFTLTISVSDGLESATKTFTHKINQLPVLTALGNNFPSVAKPGATLTGLQVSGATDPDNDTLLYTITSTNPDVVLTNAKNISAGQQFTCTVPSEVQLARGETFPLTISVSDGSESVEKTVTIQQNRKPDISGLIGVTPSRIAPNSTETISFYGAIDPDGQVLTYSIIGFDSTALAFSKAVNIVDNEQVVMTVKAAAVRGQTYEFTLRVIDTLGEYVEQKYSFKVNTLPNIAGMTHNIEAILKPAATYANLKIAGVTDVDGDNLLFTITANNGVTITNGASIESTDTFTLKTPAVGVLGRGSTFTLTVSVFDGYETVTKNFTFKINTLPDLTAVTETLLAKLKPATAYPNILVRGATDSDGQTLTYTITASNGVTVTNGNAIGENSPITVTTPATTMLARGGSFTLTVSVSDGLESASKTFTHTINRLPDLTALSHNFPAVVKPSATSSGMKVSGATDADGDSLSYTITASNPNVILTGSSGIVANTAFSFQAPSVAQLARGATFDLIVAVSDGQESVSRNITITQNNLPDATSITHTLVSTMEGGAENAVTFKIAGGTDANGQALTYNIVNANAQLSFSKTTGITAADTITLTATKVATDVALTFTITATDSLGETSSNAKTVNITVTAIIVTEAPTITYPINNEETVAYKGFNMTWSPYAAVVWTGTGAYPNN